MVASLLIRVHKIQGNCPIFQEGDEFLISDGYILESSRVRLCMHALSSLMPYYIALSRGITAADLGLATTNDPRTAYIQCLDPYKLTRGGTVTFCINVQ